MALQLRLLLFFLVLAVAVASWVATCASWQLDQVAAGVRPLEPRHFSRLTVVTAGTGGAYENPARRGPITALGLGSRVVLVDCGRSAADALRAAEIPVSQPDSIYLTSLMPENTVGLDDLRFSAWLEGRREPLRLVGPAGTRELAGGLARAHERGLRARGESLGLEPAPPFDVVEIADGWQEAGPELGVRAGALPDGPVEAFAYRFEAGGRSAVVSGTGWAPDALVAFSRGAHLLVHEAVFVPTPRIADELGLDPSDRDRLAREAALHTSIEQVGALARRAGVEVLALVRLRPPPVYDAQITLIVDDDFPGRIAIPDDGDALTP